LDAGIRARQSERQQMIDDCNGVDGDGPGEGHGRDEGLVRVVGLRPANALTAVGTAAWRRAFD
jgi:hypothetical protein